MSETSQSELRDAIDYMKVQSGAGSKARKQDKFTEVYTESVGYLLAGERYDDAGVGPATAREAVSNALGEVPDADTLTESVAQIESGGETSLLSLVADLDDVAELSGNEQQERLEDVLARHSEPSLATLALLDDESIGLGTSQMRGAFFDGTRDERKHRESFTESTTEFIQLAQIDSLPTGPTVGEPFEPMLAVPESRGEPDNPMAQTKVDGYRIILHISGNSATAFSRRENDVTESLPELQEIDWPDGEYILDGEVIAETGSYSDTSQRIGRAAENVERDVEMEFALFDILVAEGEEIWQEPLHERHSRLVTFVGVECEDERVFHLGLTGDIAVAKDEAVANGEEGIIVKDFQAPYEFGKRSTYFQKQKVDDESVDLVVSGFKEGDGKATGTLGRIRLETSDGVFVGYSGSGFTDEERDAIWNNQDEWLGRCVEIEARGLGTEGKLRMPIFVRDRKTDGTADSFSRVKELMKDV